MSTNIWLVGAGGMAIDYAKVIKGLGLDFFTIGRAKESAKFFQEATECNVILGGLSQYLVATPKAPTHAIIAVGIEQLYETTLQLLEYGVKNILVEKPAGLNKNEVQAICLKAKEKNAQLYVAYNRRYYASVLKAQEIIAEDGGLTSFNFEFTEWAHEIRGLNKADGVKQRWFLGNSTHVVDLAFYLGGAPKRISTFTSGSLDWHPAASVFSGAGIADGGALFNYQANWDSAGRWSVEMLTKKHRLILRPMEKLQIQKKGSVAIELAQCDYKLDEIYKPGLFLQTKAFIFKPTLRLCDIAYHSKMMDIYYAMASYD